MLETEIHLFRYSAIPLFRIPGFSVSPNKAAWDQTTADDCLILPG